MSDRPSAPDMLPGLGPAPGDRQFLIFCDGGLANRINSLLSGLAIAARLGLGPVILWPRNNRCGAAFADIFASSARVFETRLQDLLPFEDRLRVWLHENDYGFAAANLGLRSLPGIDALGEFAGGDSRSVLFAENIVLPWLPVADVDRALATLAMRPAIADRAAELIRRQPTDSFVGIHLRATDFLSPPPVEPMLELVAAHPGNRFFVCSDDPGLERRFAEFANVFIHEKSEYVAKLGDGEWRGDVIDSDGLPYTSNIDRSGQSVVEAAVDLLLLAASTPVRTSLSSFLSLAERLKSSGFAERHLRRSPAAGAAPPATPAAAPLAQDRPMNTTAKGPYTSQEEILELLGLIKPRHLISDVKVRIGGDGDGGYVMPSLALSSNLVVSIGIGDQVSFDLALAERGARVLQFDHTIGGPPAAHPNVTYRKLGWGPRDEGELVCLRTMMAMADWTDARRPILKFDTEGAEWDSLDVTESADLARFEVIAGEFHGFQSLLHRDYFERTKRVLEKLAATHHPVHLHANNATGIVLVVGIPIPPLLEITFLRKDVAAFGGHSTEPIPGPLDRPNMADRPDLCLRPF